MTELRLLGPVEALNGDGPMDLGGARPARVLVALYTAERHRLDLDALVDRCFDDGDRPEDAVPAIRTAVRRLRRAIGDDVVATQPGGYELDLASLDVDVERFDELIAAGRAASDPVAAVTSFGRALDLWRGRPFGDLGELDWLAPERIRLEESHLLALEGWHDAHLRNGTATEIIPSLEAATLEHPMRERFHRQLMRALYLADRQAAALRAFQTYRKAMAEAGLEPGPETVDLERRIAQGDASLKTATAGRPLRGYRIVERLGEGAFSIVYRGTQPSVDRDVAIKQIRAELANRPDFIRRFEAEAHMVAHLEHPFIVPLYDYWREPGSAYLVMRLLPGGSLESSLLDGAWGVDRTARMVGQVGAALSTAHRSGIVHRDVKPANILLDDEGNSFLTDFGIALAESELVDPEASLSAGSPAYASPEQLRREPVGPSADVHGLAIAVYEALTGRLPFPDEPNQAALLQRQLHDPIPTLRSSRTDVPVAVDDVLQRATAKSAADRFQTVDEFVAAFEAALGTPMATPVPGAATVIPAEERNPYKGLRAFDEADAADFAGRDRLVDQLVAGLASNRILAVVGPSGSGKSSAVRAGLLPALRRGAVPGSADWFVATVMPGAHPDEELEAALLRIATERPPGLIDVLRDGDRGISRALRQVLPEGGQLLLVIDQFEELFTLCDDEGERRRFLDGLAAAVSEERSRLHVIVTLRADFYDRPLRYETIGRLVRDATVPVLPLAADELERAIVDPARSVGAEFEPGLVSEIAADVADQPGALPLLQYALTELYDRRISNLLTRDAYHSIGGVTGALAARAEELHEGLGPAERLELRRLFGRLVTLGEGTEDTRRRVVRGELGGSDTVDIVIDRFGRARLFSFDRDPVSRAPTIEVAHEALLREWPRLRGWLDVDRDGLRTHRHLTETTAAWIASGRDAGELYRGGRLETAGVWAADHGDDLNEAEREFLAASVAQRTAEEAAERAHAEHQARSNRRLRVLVAVATIVALIAGVAGVFAFRERNRADDAAAQARDQAELAKEAQTEAEANAAEADANAADAIARGTEAAAARIELADALAEVSDERDRAETERIASLAASSASDDRQLALLLAVEAYNRSPGSRTLGALQQVFAAIGPYLGVLGAGEPARGAFWLEPDLVVTIGPGGVHSYDPTTGERLDSSPGPVVELTSRRADGQIVTYSLGSASASLGVAVARVDDPTRLQVLDASTLEPRWDHDHGAVIDAVAAGPDAVATLDERGNLRIFDAAGVPTAGPIDAHPEVTLGQQVLPDSVRPLGQVDDVPLRARPRHLEISADRVITSSGFVTKIWSGSGDLLHETITQVEALGATLAVQPRSLAGGRGSTEFVWAQESYIAVIDAATNAELSAVTADSTTFNAGTPKVVAIEMLASSGIWILTNDGRLTLQDETTGSVDRSIELGLNEVGGFSLSPDGRAAVVAGREGTEVVSTTGEGVIATSTPGIAPMLLTIDSSGKYVAASTADPLNVVGDRVYAIERDQLRELEATFVPGQLSFPPSGTYLNNNTLPFAKVQLIDPSTLEQVVTFDNAQAWTTLAGSASGGYYAFGESGSVGLFDAATGQRIGRSDIVAESVTSVTFSADESQLLVSFSDRPPALLDVPDLKLVGEPLGDQPLRFAAYSADHSAVVTVGDGGRVRLHDPVTFDLEVVLETSQLPTDSYPRVHLVADGRLVLTTVNGDPQLYDRATGNPVGGRFPNDPGVNFGGRTGVDRIVSVIDGHIVLWNVDIDSWPELACRAAGRNMTIDEWVRVGPGDAADYRATCPQWPAAPA